MIRILIPVFVAALAGTATAQEAPQIEKGKQVYGPEVSGVPFNRRCRQ